MTVIQFFQFPGLTPVELKRCEKKLQRLLDKDKLSRESYKLLVETESCYYIDTRKNGLTSEEEEVLLWVLKCPFSSRKVSNESFLGTTEVVEIGPRLNFSTAFSTNAVSICHSVGLTDITRIEKSTRYYLQLLTSNNSSHPINSDLHLKMVALLFDRMTEVLYISPVTSFHLHSQPDAVFEIDLLAEGKVALEKTSKRLGLSFDSWDIDFYTTLFLHTLKRNPTSVECFDLAQSNSEHCRHWYFKGRFIIDGKECAKSLLDMVIDTQQHTNDNNVIKFSDNSSAIKGFPVRQLRPELVGNPSPFILPPPSPLHIVFTAETHNFPTGVAPFQGATTGTGGRIRDVQATGRGARVVAGTVGYCVGCLNVPDYPFPWEATAPYPSNLATPLDILIEASNGASDYGNKFGEPLLGGFSRSFGMLDLSGERREWLKPIMFTGGIGSMYSKHVHKLPPALGMKVVKVGGPVLRIGVGGGSASSASVQDDQRDELNFNAVQRGDAEMGEKMNRVIRACFEQDENNPVCSIHDQGAGGNGNVLKELCHPGGATIRLSAFELGDPSLSALEVWTAEYQESNALLVKEECVGGLLDVAKRERCSVSVVGEITGDNMITFIDDRVCHANKRTKNADVITTKPPIQLDLDLILGKVPRKDYHVSRIATSHTPINLPHPLSVHQVLQRVLRLPSVASKRYLTSKVDRSVSGLVAQQQCVGPLHTPLADVAVVALSPFDVKGSATAIGEQPIKCLVDAACGARMAVAEALTNLVFAYVGDIRDVKCSANWMWPAKLPGEDARLYDACVGMTSLMAQLGVGVDGGKDSLSMAAKVDGSIVKSPGSVVVSTYAACDDITLTITPDLKCPQGRGHLIHIPLSPGKHRIGGTALAQCYGFVGTESPDLENPQLFVAAFQAIQELIKGRKIRSGHDVSDGGLLTCVLEMAFAGNCGLELDLNNKAPLLEYMFNEEAGYVLEVTTEDLEDVSRSFEKHHVTFLQIGYSNRVDMKVCVKYNGQLVLTGNTPELRHTWEDTSFHLEHLQSNATCANQEAASLLVRKGPTYHVTFDPDEPMTIVPNPSPNTIRVALLREEGSNGDREMAAALFMAGFTVVDVNMQDLISQSIVLDEFRGVVFVGGFSYADVFGSAKGWATAIRYNASVCLQFQRFLQRQDTFSLGVCNGCQLMSYLRWVGTDDANKENDSEQGVMLERNLSERYECRFVSVKVQESASMMLQGMEGSVLGAWVAHAEGRFKYRNDEIRETIRSNHLVSLTYVDDDGHSTQEYPMNPNGSEDAIAAVCSHDGRHLAMMPHPERSVLRWQWPWISEGQEWTTSPWLRMFHTAHKWCLRDV